MLVPYLTIADPKAAMALYEKALGATTTMKMDGPDDSIMHAEMSIGGHTLMLSAEWPGMAEAPNGRSSVNFMLYVPDVDEALKTAVSAGMTVVSEVELMFWGDKNAKVNDGHGYEWTFAEKVEDVLPEEIKRRADEWAAANMGG